MDSSGTCYMKIMKGTRVAVLLLLGMIGAVLLEQISFAAGPELSFDTLQVGTQLYKNVTVTTRTSDYIFILHSGGMKNIRVSDLSPEELETLGYTAAKPRKSASETAQTWAKTTLEAPRVKAVQQQLEQRFKGRIPAEWDLKKVFTPTLILAVLAGMLVIHLFISWCCALICVKAGTTPGVAVWLPVFQIFPLLRAAGMSPLWFLAYFVPVLNVLAQVMWSLKIADARGKNALVGIMLLVPLLNFLVFLYLAFSNGVEREKKPEPRKVQIMTLETA